VKSLFGRTSPSISTLTLVFALLTALVFTTSVAAVQQRAFELMWALPRVRSVRSYLRQLTWAVALGAFSIGILLIGRWGRAIDAHVVALGTLASAILQGLITFVFYWWSQRWLIGGRVSWRALLPGAIAIAVATSVLVRLSRVIMPGQISWQVDAYGLIGGVFVLSVWLMILSAVIFGGVLIGVLITERRAARSGADPGSRDASPLTLAGLRSAADREETAPMVGR
jgi:membrane protein